ncbi:unnamed protein product, partial [Musa acuminata subsp. burmannicoides]
MPLPPRERRQQAAFSEISSGSGRDKKEQNGGRSKSRSQVGRTG